MKKQVLINFENEEYECKIESNDKENINITLENNGFLKFNGGISLKEIYLYLKIIQWKNFFLH